MNSIQAETRTGSTAWVRKAMSYFLAVMSDAEAWTASVGTPISLATSLMPSATELWNMPVTATTLSSLTRRR